MGAGDVAGVLATLAGFADTDEVLICQPLALLSAATTGALCVLGVFEAATGFVSVSYVVCKYEAPATSATNINALPINNLYSLIGYTRPGKKSLLILNRETPIPTSVCLKASTIPCGPER